MPDYQYNPTKDRPVEIQFAYDTVILTLADGRAIATPLGLHPWLLNASSEQRSRAIFDPFSVYWDDLDEGLDVEWMIREAETDGEARWVETVYHESLSKRP
jgi:hypothetical protein